ncbi:hypothetical protein AN618_18600 [Fervidicola ferrireducens]|uniref:RRXRR domain-containing protein n=1 Tax=Fervidicola ferrireducens TaxID=520764 RepID=A0A140L4L7_9FIRM|nr:hypothetical protein [Fervidicola ferrireducens]KXG75492.1 hypothetical protein AN618_18600 [Fervidicola ferrireducens]
MVLFTADKYGRPGHPTKRFDMIRKLKKRGGVKIIGGGASGKPPVVVFLDREFDYSKTVPRKFIIALDPGYNYIGFVVCEMRKWRLLAIFLLKPAAFVYSFYYFSQVILYFL